MLDEYTRIMNQASAVFGVPLKRHTNAKAHGPCPLCKGSDRFLVWLYEGTGWCSRCRWSGSFMEVSDEQRSEAKIDKEKRQNEARVSMASCKDWVVYHGMIEDEGNRGLWHAEGMTDDDIRTWGLGYCSQCPIASEYPSLTIPVFYSRQLVDIRHKLIGVPKDRADQVGKYRSHKSGLVPHPFNLDILDETEEVIVVEGEKKPIILIRYGFSDVLGIPGAAITEDLLKRAAALSSRRRFTLALDPGTGKNSKALARDLLLLGHEVFLADPFVKPDDLVRKYGGEVFRDVLRQARRARA